MKIANNATKVALLASILINIHALVVPILIIDHKKATAVIVKMVTLRRRTVVLNVIIDV